VLISYSPHHAFIYGNTIRPALQTKIRFVTLRVSSQNRAHIHQGYEDDLHETEEEDDDNGDASYGDEEYGSKKKPSKKRKQPSKPKGNGSATVFSC
jgi:hypothetical protein